MHHFQVQNGQFAQNNTFSGYPINLIFMLLLEFLIVEIY